MQIKKEHDIMLDAWENRTLDYDLNRYPWPDWIREVIQEVQPQVGELARFHEVVSPDMISVVTSYVQDAFSRPEFAQRFDDFAEQYLKPLISGKRYMIKRQATLNLVVPEQRRLGRMLPFHQGVWYDNGRGQRTIWCALTPCYGTNSMWVVDTPTSREISKATIRNRWNQEEFERACLQHARSVEIQPGQCHLFQQEIIHGNVNNTTGVTRMSIDWHLLVEGGEFAHRWPGGFFRFPGDRRQAQRSATVLYRNFVQYTGCNTQFDQGIPTYMQRMVMDQYCREYGITTVGVQFENQYLTWLPVLERCIRDRPPGIVLLSIWSLPDDINRCLELLDLALDLGVNLHFANEYLCLCHSNDRDRIIDYRTFAVHQSGAHSWEH